MLYITIPPFNVFDEATESFISVSEPIDLEMENSLWAIAEWEKKYKKPWFPDSKASKVIKDKQAERTPDEMLYFIRCMITNYKPNKIQDSWLSGLTEGNFKKITDYLQDPQTALTHIPDVKPDKKKKKTPEVRMTSERIYAWMFELQMPLEVEFWNINRLMNTIQVINYDNTPDDRKGSGMKQAEIAQDYAKINEQRLKALGKTKG